MKTLALVLAGAGAVLLTFGNGFGIVLAAPALVFTLKDMK